MRRRAVIFDADANADLEIIYDWIAETASPTTALSFVQRIASHCSRFDIASERGRRRDDIRTGLRVVGLMRKVEIAFVVEDERVTILRVFYGGVDWERALSDLD